MIVIYEHIYPPIPIRQFDYCCWVDGDDETGPYGCGRTKQQALRDLADQIEMEQAELEAQLRLAL